MGFKKNIFLIILIGFLISSITGLFNLKKYDQISNQPHSMIMGDIKLIWTEAEELKRDLYDGKNYFNSGRQYTRTYLPSKILALYSHISGQELFENFENKKIENRSGEGGLRCKGFFRKNVITKPLISIVMPNFRGNKLEKSIKYKGI
jgi:hypothetical protein